MIEYKVVKVENRPEANEEMLNRLAREGYKLVLKYNDFGVYFILEKDTGGIL